MNRSPGIEHSMRYTALIDGEPDGFGVAFPDLPGSVAMGSTIEHAIDNAAEVLPDFISAAEEIGGSVPRPSPLNLLRSDPEVAEALADGATLASIPLVRAAGRSVRANLSLGAGILAGIDAEARRRRIARSALVSRWRGVFCRE